jgi:hypothetical protein
MTEMGMIPAKLRLAAEVFLQEAKTPRRGRTRRARLGMYVAAAALTADIIQGRTSAHCGAEMTLPALHRRSTTAERRANRVAYQQQKTPYEASPEHAAYQARNRRGMIGTAPGGGCKRYYRAPTLRRGRPMNSQP